MILQSITLYYTLLDTFRFARQPSWVVWQFRMAFSIVSNEDIDDDVNDVDATRE